MALPLYYNWRNLFVRKLSTGLTFTVVAVIVAVLGVLLSFAEGIKESLRASGDPANILVLKTGATAESTSIINPEEAGRIIQAPGIGHDAKGDPLLSQELAVQTTLQRKDGRGVANVAVRGVDLVAFDVHTEVRIVEGRRFESGQLEMIVGKATRERYKNLSLGDEVQLGRTANRVYKVVGVFEAGGGALESEMWGPRTQLADSYNRRFLSSVVIRLENAARANEALGYLKGPAVRLQPKTETGYYEDLSSKTRDIVWLTTILIGLMGAGAIFAVANTMYAAVDSRKREIAMLRTIGFSRRSIIGAFIIESLFICVAACVFGLAVSLLVSGSRQDYLSDTTWTVLAFELRVTPVTIVSAILVSTLVGLVGGLAPALRASRTRIIEALRKT